MSMTVQPYPLWIVWDEPDRETRQTYYARVIGWREVTERRVWSEAPSTGETHGPYPVVVHPETQLPATLGHDGPAPVSRMEDYDDLSLAVARQGSRRRVHGGAR